MAWIGRFLVNGSVGLWASFFIVLMPYWVSRTWIGWFDTDGIIVFLFLSQLALASSLLVERKRSYFLYSLTLYLIITWLFYRAWDQSPAMVMVFSIYPLIFLGGFNRKNIYYLSALIISIGVVVLSAPVSFIDLIRGLADVVGYVVASDVKVQNTPYSPTSISIGEQQPLEWSETIREVFGGVIQAVLVVLGFLFFLYHRFSYAIVIMPAIVIGIIGLFLAERFLIFFAPVLAISFGCSIWYLSSIINRIAPRLYRVAPASVGILLLLSIGFLSFKSLKQNPIVPASVVKGLIELRNLPEDAVVWNNCDYGYAIIYWARRPSTCDGSSHTSLRRTAMAYPFYVDSAYVATAFMRFFSVRGAEGLAKIMKFNDNIWLKSRDFIRKAFSFSDKGRLSLWLSEKFGMPSDEAERMADFLWPEQSRPLYFIITRQDMRNAHWWFWFSTWDGKKGKGIHPYYVIFPEIPTINGRGVIKGGNAFKIDLINGIVEYRDKYENLAELNLNMGSGDWLSKRFEPRTDHMILDIMYSNKGNNGFGVLYDPLTSQSVGHKLFVGREGSGLFEDIYIDPPDIQVWKINKFSVDIMP
ncbi:MAG: hypothetical protein CMI01_01165 [Oceanospirillaceae bacterium]|nr:hypothetical protein [Oceanospirillaceae bacterium]